MFIVLNAIRYPLNARKPNGGEGRMSEEIKKKTEDMTGKELLDKLRYICSLSYVSPQEGPLVAEILKRMAENAELRQRIAELEAEKAELARTLASISKTMSEGVRCGEERCDLGICVLRRLHLGKHTYRQDTQGVSMINFCPYCGARFSTTEKHVANCPLA